MNIDKDIICIVCPVGCRMHVQQQGEGSQLTVTGNECPRGRKYAVGEITRPMRTVTSSILVENGQRRLCSVKTAQPIPKSNINDAVAEISKIRRTAPISIGDVIISGVAGTNTDVIATANCPAAEKT